MGALAIADMLVARHGDAMPMTYPRLAALVYLTQAVSLHQCGTPLFGDVIEAWDCGPVTPAVHHAFAVGSAGGGFADGIIRHPHAAPAVADGDARVVDAVMASFGTLLLFDLMRWVRRRGGAWSRAHVPGACAVMTPAVIAASGDGAVAAAGTGTLTDGVAQVNRRWPNAMRLLEDS